MHLVETMAYAGEKPWHGLGNKLAPQQPIDVWKKNAGMDWQIEQSEVFYVSGTQHVGVINTFPRAKGVVSLRYQSTASGGVQTLSRGPARRDPGVLS
jgi:hypothetical protein